MLNRPFSLAYRNAMSYSFIGRFESKKSVGSNFIRLVGIIYRTSHTKQTLGVPRLSTYPHLVLTEPEMLTNHLTSPTRRYLLIR